MKTINKVYKYRSLLYIALIAGLLIFLDMWFVGKELIIRSPIIIRNQLISPQDEEQIREEAIRMRIEYEVEEALKEIKEKDLKSLGPTGAAYAQSNLNCYYYAMEYAEIYGVDKGLAECILEDESGGSANAEGDSGQSWGCWQFKLPTWQMFRKEMGLSTADMRKDPKESTRTAIWAFANGKLSHWSPWLDGRCK